MSASHPWMLIGLAALSFATLASAGERKKLTLSITHPGFESKQAEKHELEVQMDDQGNPQAYFMAVKSVFCSDEKCDVITLMMEWDAIGRFTGYQLPAGNKLTKYDHEPFEKADYAKFDQLMKNRGSVLADLDSKQIVVKKKDPKKKGKRGTKPKPKDVAGEGDALQKVDAISGATPSYIQEEVVEGAAYTCYTMWHWANGNTAEEIRKHAQQQGKPGWLSGLLTSKDAGEIDFALQAIAQRKLQGAEIQRKVIAAAKASSMDGFKVLVNYLAQTHPKKDQLYAAYQELMAAAADKRRVYLLEQILKQNEAPPMAFLEQAATQLPDYERFYELQLFLSLAEKHETGSDKLLSAIAKVLEHENFFFSRRAHGFLKPRKLPAKVQVTLEAYEKKHQGRL